MTKNSKLILDIVRSSHSHPTAKEIFDKIKTLSGGTVMATVYNNLAQLTEQGLIRKIEIPDGADRYDTVDIPHDHMICERCGDVCDVMMEDLTDTLCQKTGQHITSYSLIVKHVCNRCKALPDENP